MDRYEARRTLINPRTGAHIARGAELPADFPGLATLLANGGARLLPAAAPAVPPGAITEGLELEDPDAELEPDEAESPGLLEDEDLDDDYHEDDED